MELTVDCKKRPEGSKPNALRRGGQIPAVLYGHKGTESIALTLDARAAETLVRKSSLNNTLIKINAPDVPWSGKALLREVQSHPWKRNIYHLSFFSVSASDKLEVTVPIHFVGTALGAKQEGGSVDTVLNELEVSCTGDSIPDAIEVDITNMNIGDAIRVSELPLPPGVVALGEGDRVVVSILGKATQTAEEAAEDAE